MINLKDRELLNQFLASPLIKNHTDTQQILDAYGAQSMLFKEKVTELRNLLNSDYITTDYDLLEMMSQYFDPMHVFKILSMYIDPNRLTKELLFIFRLRGSETVKNLLFEVFLKYYNLSVVTNHETGELIIDSTYDLERFIDYYYIYGKYIDLNIMETVKLLCRELLVGGHKLYLNYLGVLIELCTIDNTQEVWSMHMDHKDYEDISNTEDKLIVSPIYSTEIGPPSSAGYRLLPAGNETLNEDWVLGHSYLNEFDGKKYIKVDADLPEMKRVIVIMNEAMDLSGLVQEIVQEPGRDIYLDDLTSSDKITDELLGKGKITSIESFDYGLSESLIHVITRYKDSNYYTAETIFSRSDPQYSEVGSDMYVGSVVQISNDISVEGTDDE